MTRDYQKLDEAMLPLHAYIRSLTAFNGQKSDDTEWGVAMNIERLQIETPFEMEVQVGENGVVTLGTTPPLYHVDTGIQPVFHHMRITIESFKPEESPFYGE